jgi:hypothetical protein
MDNKPRDETSQTLLDDADFLRLMEAEYKSAKASVDELEKQRSWSDIRKKISTRKTRFHRGLLLVAAVILGFIPFATMMQKPDELAMKGHGPEADVQLEIQLLNAEGRPVTLEKILVGQTLVFKVSSPTASYIALALQIDSAHPEVQFQPERPIAGQDQILAADNQAFVYQLDQSGQTLKFCLLAARTREDLQHKMENLSQQWPRIGAQHCQTLVVP